MSTPNKITKPIVDWPASIKAAGNKADIATELLDMLLASLPADLQAITTLVKQRQYAELADALHKFKGALCYLSLPELHHVTIAFETAIKSEHYQHLDAHLTALQQAAQRLQQQAKQLVSQQQPH